MRPCFHVEIETPKKVLLNGLWFGPKKSKSVVIMVHGLTGSLFSMRSLVESLVSNDTAVLTFNNRGFEQISSVKRRVGAKAKYVTAGTTHEVFKDSVDDIQGAVNFVRSCGVRSVFIAGHSTGANKVVYWSLSGRGAQGIILLGPLSDYSGALKAKGAAQLKRGVAVAKKLVKAGKPHALMPRKYGEWFECDAQRFLSLYTPDSAEEMFTYARPGVAPKILRKAKTPMLVFLAGADEYGDKPAETIRDWFLDHIYEGEPIVIPGVDHSFKGGERALAKEIKSWISRI